MNFSKCLELSEGNTLFKKRFISQYIVTSSELNANLEGENIAINMERHIKSYSKAR